MFVFLGEEMIDAFMFLNELDLLEIRLNSLSPHIDRFVLCECPFTHSGKPKPLYFKENKGRFKDFNITHLILPSHEGRSPMQSDHYQRNYLMNGITDVDPEEIVLISDLDEIPDLRNYQGQEGVFKHKLYYYYLNTFTGKSTWRGTIAMKRKNISSFQHLRNNLGRIAGNGFGGWHFSTLGTAENVVYKIEAFAHQELNTEEVKNNIRSNRDQLLDPYNRGPGSFITEEITGPEWLVSNQHKYEHLIYRRNG